MVQVRGLKNERRVGIGEFKAFDVAKGSEYDVPEYVAEHLIGSGVVESLEPPAPDPEIARLKALLAERDAEIAALKAAATAAKETPSGQADQPEGKGKDDGGGNPVRQGRQGPDQR